MSRRASTLDVPEWMTVDDAVSQSARRALQHRDKAARRASGEPPERALLPLWARWAGTLLNGQQGRYPGRVPWEIRVPRHLESTAAVRGLYPWLAGRPMPQVGPIFGREVISGGLWHIDPWAHRAMGRVNDSGVFVTGVIGSGKSAGAKSLCVRHTGFGRPFVVPADLRGEWVPVAEAVGGKVMKLGPGMPDRLNALAMPSLPAGMDQRQWWLMVHTHWYELVESLGQTLLPNQRELNPIEKNAILEVLKEATRYDAASGNVDRLRPISLHPVVQGLRQPSQELADILGMDREVLRDELRHLGLALRLLTEGPMQGLVDSDDQDNRIDPSRPATVIDISRVQTSDAAIALTMACTQSVIELAFVHQVQQWWLVYDELWRLMKFAALLQRMNGGQRRSRGSGAGALFLTHRATDSQLGGESAQKAASSLIADCATKIIYRQRADTIRGTLEMVSLTNMVASQLSTLPRGRAVHVVDGDPFLVDHLLPPKRAGIAGIDRELNEWDIIETDQVLSDDYRTLAGLDDDALFAGIAA